jgi:hypothetical protein
VGVLEGAGEAADQMVVSYNGTQLKLEETYRNVVSELIRNLQKGTPLSFTPYVY